MRALVLVLALGSLAGCLYPDKEYAYSCVGQPAPTTAPQLVIIRGVTTDPATRKPIPMVEVDLRPGGGMPVACTTSDSAGSFELQLSTPGSPVSGIVLHAMAAGRIDSFYFPAHPVSGDMFVAVPVLSTADRDGIALATNVPFQPGTGSVLLDVADCHDQGLPGATVTSSAGGTVFYFNGDMPAPGATATDVGGVVLIPNLTPGVPVTVTALVDGNTVTSAPITIEPDAFSITELRP